MSLVVSDTSPVRALAYLRRLDLLPALFGTVLIPPAVVVELAQPPRPHQPVDAQSLAGVEVRAPTNRFRVQELLRTLGTG